MLFARADEIIEPGKSGSGTRSEEAAPTHGRNAGLKSVVAKSQAISCGPPLSGWPANFFSQANEVMSARGKIRKSIDSKNLAKVDFWTFPALRGSVQRVRRFVVVFATNDVVPHVVARETHQWS